MTVKSRLLISHLIMFIVPIFMAVIVAAVMLAGALILSRGNNYLYLENISKCTRAAEISCHIFFHGNLEHPENSAGRWLISLLSPKQNLTIPFTPTETKTIWHSSPGSRRTPAGRIGETVGQVPISVPKMNLFIMPRR